MDARMNHVRIRIQVDSGAGDAWCLDLGQLNIQHSWTAIQSSCSPTPRDSHHGGTRANSGP